ncbi:heavy-metal-associated domain-containing protein [Rodentibacter caecimuris]|uniref:heavy-metal-associated domain-containing protein n=1 Tax=Rodentibacter caecimuris TaxID=1796644 RepID=UPI0013A08BC7|nr:heavy-metal-associated domain-containing protein [Rodentibacter heylii]MCX2961909.1 cation transporter [Rodentibacter heylii]QIA77725.1 heavy-metal-associated domain-containing protein [Rodentibacter heylii]
MKNVRLTVTGMHCGGCVKSVTHVLKELDGVAQVNVALEGYADIQFDESKVSVTRLIDAIEEAGFDATE